MTTRQLAEAIGVVPATIVQYENNLHPIPHDTAILLANLLEIDVSLLFDEFASFIAAPYTTELKKIRKELNLNQREFADMIGIVPNYYYKIESGVRRPSRRIYHQIMKCIELANRQASQSNYEQLQ